MSNIFDYTTYFSNPTAIRRCWRYNPRDEVNHYFIKEQYGEDHRLGMFFNEQHEEDGDPDLEEVFDREVLNTFLADVCSRIDVDPAEAIAQNFTLYLPMVEWLRTRYYQQVAQKFEEKLHEHYQELCETVYDYMIEEGHFTECDSTKKLIARELQHHFRNTIDHSGRWGIEIDWILTLSEGNVAEACEEHMVFDDIAMMLNETILATEAPRR